jgi:broad specificity phosphatase PhoE
LGERWAGHTWESLDDVFPGELTAYLDHPEHLPFVSESLAELAARVERAVRLHQSASDGPLIVVSHQDPIQAARLSLTGRPGSGLHRDKPKHASVIELEPRPVGFWAECSMWAPDQDPVGRQPIAS